MSVTSTSAITGVEACLDQVERVDGFVNAVCTINPHAVDDAARLDAEAAQGRHRSVLHGQAILVKDNIDTSDLLTTAGSLALAERPPAADAPLVTRLREAGLVVVGKTNLSEWANMRDPSSTSGWSAYGGLTRNPYALNRSAGGSSSGSGAGVSARMAPYAIGTETDGSITSPAAFNGCVGIKPTVGVVPGDGIVPISASQDTAGPMALTVQGAAELLTVLTDGDTDYGAAAVAGRLAGKRIGLPRQRYWGYSPLADSAAERAVELLSAQGAVIVEDTNLESMLDYPFDDELVVLLAEMRDGLARYLATRPTGEPESLDDIVQFNRDHSAEELCYFGQGFLERALSSPDVASPEYGQARSECLRRGRDDGIDAVLRAHDLDALMTPSFAPAIPIDLVNPEHHWGSCTQPAAMAGYPLVTVPAALVQGLPVGVTFWGTANSEATLIEIAAGYEAARDAADGPLPPPTYPQFV
jgi:amidase